MATMTKRKAKTKKDTPYVRCIVQRYKSGPGWYDCSELFHYLPSAEAALKRFQEDLPGERFRLASLEWGNE